MVSNVSIDVADRLDNDINPMILRETFRICITHDLVLGESGQMDIETMGRVIREIRHWLSDSKEGLIMDTNGTVTLAVAFMPVLMVTTAILKLAKAHKVVTDTLDWLSMAAAGIVVIWLAVGVLSGKQWHRSIFVTVKFTKIKVITVIMFLFTMVLTQWYMNQIVQTNRDRTKLWAILLYWGLITPWLTVIPFSRHKTAQLSYSSFLICLWSRSLMIPRTSFDPLDPNLAGFVSQLLTLVLGSGTIIQSLSLFIYLDYLNDLSKLSSSILTALIACKRKAVIWFCINCQKKPCFCM